MEAGLILLQFPVAPAVAVLGRITTALRAQQTLAAAEAAQAAVARTRTETGQMVAQAS